MTRRPADPDSPPKQRRLGVAVVPLPTIDDIGVEISIDGRPLLDLVRDAESRFGGEPAGSYAAAPLHYLGLVAERRDGRLVHAGPGAFDGRKAVPLLVCTCGQAGCWSLEADIHVDEEAVRWSNFSSTLSQRLRGANYKSIEPLVFERKAYFKALARLAPAIGSVLKKRNAALASASQARRMARGRTGNSPSRVSRAD